MTDCLQCSKDVNPSEGEMVIIPNYLWLVIANTHDVLCVSCIESRLERKLNHLDFPKTLSECYRGQMEHLRDIFCNQKFFEKYNIVFSD